MYMEGEVGEQYDTEGGVNKPALLTGMKAIKFNNPTADTKGSVNTDVTEGWYNYEAKEWANAQTEDGSMWVWIPRFAYKITYYTDATKTNESTEKTQYGSIDVKFLIGETDQYYNETTGKLDTAIRAKTANDEIDATGEKGDAGNGGDVWSIKRECSGTACLAERTWENKGKTTAYKEKGCRNKTLSVNETSDGRVYQYEPRTYKYYCKK